MTLALPGLEPPNPVGARCEADFFPTPRNVWRPFVPILRRHLADRGDALVVEPACGDGRLLQWLATDCGVPAERLRGFDVRAEAVEQTRARGFEASRLDWVEMAPAVMRDAGPIIVVTNPPFRIATPFAQACLAVADVVALLLRITWFEPTQDRVDFLASHPCDVWVPPSRGRFAGGGTDSATTVWCVWPGSSDQGHLVRYLGRQEP